MRLLYAILWLLIGAGLAFCQAPRQYPSVPAQHPPVDDGVKSLPTNPHYDLVLKTNGRVQWYEWVPKAVSQKATPFAESANTKATAAPIATSSPIGAREPGSSGVTSGVTTYTLAPGVALPGDTNCPPSG